MSTGRRPNAPRLSVAKDELLGPIPQAAVGAVSLGALQLARYPLSLRYILFLVPVKPRLRSR